MKSPVHSVWASSIVCEPPSVVACFLPTVFLWWFTVRKTHVLSQLEQTPHEDTYWPVIVVLRIQADVPRVPLCIERNLSRGLSLRPDVCMAVLQGEVEHCWVWPLSTERGLAWCQHSLNSSWAPRWRLRKGARSPFETDFPRCMQIPRMMGRTESQKFLSFQPHNKVFVLLGLHPLVK